MESAKSELITDAMSEKIIETAEKIATTDGASTLTVRRILKELGITNRVFYNRFHNVDEVLKIAYRNTVQKVRESVIVELDSQKDFFESVTDLVATSLIVSYDTKMKFNQYIFENDSLSQSNYEWWVSEIKKLIDYAKVKGYIKDVDSDIMSYSIWCFCRGYNADAVGRNLPKEDAVKNFRYSFSLLLEGMKK
ncbi:MAG: TetR/AcrR family transcriptional regulator [Clostridia bacterium]|nr:TetR/AcrR family transcriptional regulator [Clostridia bacterium]MBR3714751.1 TetR/AcrR family transcriptional regulator [Clostridia bacterium]